MWESREARGGHGECLRLLPPRDDPGAQLQGSQRATHTTPGLSRREASRARRCPAAGRGVPASPRRGGGMRAGVGGRGNQNPVGFKAHIGIRMKAGILALPSTHKYTYKRGRQDHKAEFWKTIKEVFKIQNPDRAGRQQGCVAEKRPARLRPRGHGRRAELLACQSPSLWTYPPGPQAPSQESNMFLYGGSRENACHGVITINPKIQPGPQSAGASPVIVMFLCLGPRGSHSLNGGRTLGENNTEYYLRINPGIRETSRVCLVELYGNGAVSN